MRQLKVERKVLSSETERMHQPGLIRRMARLPMAKLRLLMEAAFWLCVARLALAFVPFPRIGRYLGSLHPSSPQDLIRDAAALQTARRVGQAVNAAAHHSPVEMVCLPRALAAWQMLHRRHVASRLHFGVPLQPEPGRAGLQTHAWLSSQGAEITGYPVAHACVELGYFARRLPPDQTRRQNAPHNASS